VRCLVDLQKHHAVEIGNELGEYSMRFGGEPYTRRRYRAKA